MDRDRIRECILRCGNGSRRSDDDLNPGTSPLSGRLRPAAVLIGLVERPAGFTILLTQRPVHLKEHGGQVSFPGGRIEPHDPDPVAAALRETEEEVGVPAARVDVVGSLDRYITRTGFDVTPVVGFVEPPYEFRPDPKEVDAVFEVPLRHVLAPGARQRHSRIHEGGRRYYYAFPYGDYYIWGATAGMLVNLCDILRQGADP